MVKGTTQLLTLGLSLPILTLPTLSTVAKDLFLPAQPHPLTLASLPELNPNPIVHLDANGRQLYANPAALALREGLSRAEQVRVRQQLRAMAAAGTRVRRATARSNPGHILHAATTAARAAGRRAAPYSPDASRIAPPTSARTARWCSAARLP